MNNKLLMPKATAVWLVDNTSLTFDQIAAFCKLHTLEVKAIADGEPNQNVMGLNPLTTGQLTREELTKAEKDPLHRLTLAPAKVVVPELKRKGSRYTPVSKRQDRPNAILWLLRNHPELRDVQIVRLIGTTKSTINAIRERTHWNSNNLSPMDPIILGLCTQVNLDIEISKASKHIPSPITSDSEKTLLSTSDTFIPKPDIQNTEVCISDAEREKNMLDTVFSNFSSDKSGDIKK